jgi:hypothetical protein
MLAPGIAEVVTEWGRGRSEFLRERERSVHVHGLP